MRCLHSCKFVSPVFSSHHQGKGRSPSFFKKKEEKQLYTRNTLSQPFNSYQSTGDNAKEMVIIRFNNSSLLAPKSCSTLPEVSKNISNDESLKLGQSDLSHLIAMVTGSSLPCWSLPRQSPGLYPILTLSKSLNCAQRERANTTLGK